jgi:hypothetical protein
MKKQWVKEWEEIVKTLFMKIWEALFRSKVYGQYTNRVFGKKRRCVYSTLLLGWFFF